MFLLQNSTWSALVLTVNIDRMTIAGSALCHKVHRDLFTTPTVFCYSGWKLRDNSVAFW